MSGQTQRQRTTAAAHPQQPPATPRRELRRFDLEHYQAQGLSPYLALAAFLMEEMNDEAYVPGERLPSIRAMAASVELSNRTVQLAYEKLVRDEYLINRRDGYFVAARERDDQPTLVDEGEAGATVPDDAAYHDPGTSLAHKAPRPRPTQTLYVQGDIPVQASRVLHLDVRTVPPTAAVALALRQPDPAAPVILRRLTLADPSGAPVEIRSRYVPAAIAAQTPLAEPEYLPGPWETAVWEYTGHAPASAESTITSRRINPREAIAFGLPNDSATALVRNVSLYSSRDASGPALSLTQHVWPGESTRLIHRHLVQP
jgi:DNA-binding GntR family transcriptional regulator